MKELYLYGLIGDGGISDKYVAEFLSKNKSEEIELHINSPGGDLSVGISIYNNIKTHGNVTTIVDSVAASAASIIAVAGKTCLIHKHASIMIHNPWRLSIGDAAELKKDAEELEFFKETVVNIFHDKTGIDKEKLSEMMNEEKWMASLDAVSLGFCDGIWEDEIKDYAENFMNMFSTAIKNQALLQRYYFLEEENKKLLNELEKVKSDFAMLEKSLGLAPASVEPVIRPLEARDIIDAFNSISEPAERTKFYKQHREILIKSL